MRSKMMKALVTIFIATSIGVTFTACKDTIGTPVSYEDPSGGTIVVKLEPNQKLEYAILQNGSLQYTTRPMRSEEVAESHTIRNYNINIGDYAAASVVIIESKG